MTWCRRLYLCFCLNLCSEVLFYPNPRIKNTKQSWQQFKYFNSFDCFRWIKLVQNKRDSMTLPVFSLITLRCARWSKDGVRIPDCFLQRGGGLGLGSRQVVSSGGVQPLCFVVSKNKPGAVQHDTTSSVTHYQQGTAEMIVFVWNKAHRYSCCRMCAPHKMSFMFSLMSSYERSHGSSDLDVCTGRLAAS